MFTTPGKIRVSTVQPSCGNKYRSAHHGLSSSAVLGMWEGGDTRIKPTTASSLSSSYTPHNIHREANSYSQNVILLRHCKRGTLHDAISFFATMQKDLFSWNIMMSTYNRLEDGGDEVLALFNQMQQEATIPNKFILASIISACATQGDVCPGKHIHARIARAQEGFCSDVVIQSALVNMYGRVGELKVARRLFDDNLLPDTALWNGMLTICSQNAKDSDCLVLYSHMVQLCVMQNKITYVLMLSVCSKIASLTEGRKLHACITALGCETDIMVGTALINMYNKCGQVDNAKDIFGRALGHDLIMWNAMIAGCSLNVKPEDVYQLYAQMQQEGAMPNEATYTSVLDVCTSSSEGKRVHAHIMGMPLGIGIIAGAALLNMYGKCGSLDEVHHYFKEIIHRDVVSWNTMISIFAKKGMNKQALQLYEDMRKEGIVSDKVTFLSILSTFMTEVELEEGKRVHKHITFVGLDLDISVANALINMYGKCSASLQDALAIFNKLSDRDIVTFVNMISACSSQAIFAEGQRIHSLIKEKKMESSSILANAIMSMYSKCGSLINARRMFDKMNEQKTAVSWSTMIATYGQHGEGKEVLYLYDQMQRTNISPEPITLISLLFAFSHAGLLDEGCYSFRFITSKYQLVVLDHFNCMIDLLGRIGCVDDAIYVIHGMPFQPNNMSWSILVCASQVHMHFDRAELASEYVLELNPDDTTGYVVLSNIYNAQCLDSV